jgi:hypothetical protein
MTSTLSLSFLERLGVTNADGDGVTYRRHLDFVIDGLSLYAAAHVAKYDLVGTLGWAMPDQEERIVSELLLETPTRKSGDRQALFVCPECGDLGCGGITAVVERNGTEVVWRDFVHENDYDVSSTDRESFEHLGPYSFDFQQYREALNAALSARRA